VTWPRTFGLAGIAAALVALGWLLALALDAAVPPLSGSTAPPPISATFSVTPVR
jgi:hypothetical protein